MAKTFLFNVTTSVSANEIMQRLINNRVRLKKHQKVKDDLIAELERRFEVEHRCRPAEMEKNEKQSFKAIEKWGKADMKKNPDDWKGKTLKLSCGEISFSLSPGKVSLIKKIAKSFEAALSLIRKQRTQKLKMFLRPQPEELDKNLVLVEFTDGRLKNEELEKVGLKVDKPETCTIKLRCEDGKETS